MVIYLASSFDNFKNPNSKKIDMTSTFILPSQFGNVNSSFADMITSMQLRHDPNKGLKHMLIAESIKHLGITL
jgi:hypothetical protein